VSKFAKAGQWKALNGRGLRGIDTVKLASILGDCRHDSIMRRSLKTASEAVVRWSKSYALACPDVEAALEGRTQRGDSFSVQTHHIQDPPSGPPHS